MTTLSLKAIKPKGPSRRTRHDVEGRNWVCAYCDRTYFKSNSLLHHARTKHSDEPTIKKFIKSQLKRSSRKD